MDTFPPTSDPALEHPAPVPVPSKNEQTMGMLCHLLALCGYAAPPIGFVVGPLIVWMLKRQEMPFVESEGKESLNFQISMLIYHLVGVAICFTVILLPIGLLLLGLIIVANIVLVVVASTKAASGVSFRYPFSIRFIR